MSQISKKNQNLKLNVSTALITVYKIFDGIIGEFEIKNSFLLLIYENKLFENVSIIKFYGFLHQNNYSIKRDLFIINQLHFQMFKRKSEWKLKSQNLYFHFNCVI